MGLVHVIGNSPSKGQSGHCSLLAVIRGSQKRERSDVAGGTGEAFCPGEASSPYFQRKKKTSKQ